jgi:hypothetical protein
LLLSLLDSISGDLKLSIQLIIDQYLNNPETKKEWRYYFVKYDDMRKGNSGVYYWHNDATKVKNNQYEIYMMNTPLSLSGKHWDPFLFVLFKDEKLHEHLSLEDHHHPLVIKQTGEKIICNNSSWLINDKDDMIIDKISIPQENGIDNIDRIEQMKQYILSEKLKQNS